MTAHFVDLLDDLRRRSLRMASLVEDMLQETCEALLDADAGLARRVMERDGDVDTEEVAVEADVIRLLALYQPVGFDLRLLCTVLKVNNDLERIADCAVNVAERTRHFDARILTGVYKDLDQMGPIVKNMLRNAVKAFGAASVDDAQKVLLEEDAVDALYGQIIRRVVADASGSPNQVAAFLDALSVAKNFERIADHTTNIAEDVLYLCTGKIVRHRLRAR
ncbi:MAG: phosphate signaling complex protein PhoU [Phycisphaerales bacterium]|jgi:phosphate transport system protein|nr:phosphate signaling complex protein PhoU [Phycisphaerales bacterium]